jgi:hypothetical protein
MSTRLTGEFVLRSGAVSNEHFDTYLNLRRDSYSPRAKWCE